MGWQDGAILAALGGALLYLAKRASGLWSGRRGNGCGGCRACPGSKVAGVPTPASGLISIETLIRSAPVKSKRDA